MICAKQRWWHVLAFLCAAVVSVRASVDLEVSITQPVPSYLVGEIIELSVVIANRGDATASNIRVDGRVIEVVRLESLRDPAGVVTNFPAGASTLGFQIMSLPPGETKTALVRMTAIHAGAEVTAFTVFAQESEEAGHLSDNSFTLATPILAPEPGKVRVEMLAPVNDGVVDICDSPVALKARVSNLDETLHPAAAVVFVVDGQGMPGGAGKNLAQEWHPSAPGSHVLRAKLLDGAELLAESAPVVVTLQAERADALVRSARTPDGRLRVCFTGGLAHGAHWETSDDLREWRDVTSLSLVTNRWSQLPMVGPQRQFFRLRTEP